VATWGHPSQTWWPPPTSEIGGSLGVWCGAD